MTTITPGIGAAQLVSRLAWYAPGVVGRPASVFSLSMSVLLVPSVMAARVERTFHGILPGYPWGVVDSRKNTPSFWVTPMVGAMPGSVDQVRIWGVGPPSVGEPVR